MHVLCAAVENALGVALEDVTADLVLHADLAELNFLLDASLNAANVSSPGDQGSLRISFGPASPSSLLQLPANSLIRRRLSACLLYADQTVFTDPLSVVALLGRTTDFANPDEHRRYRSDLLAAVQTEVALAPLVKLRAIDLVPPLRDEAFQWPKNASDLIREALPELIRADWSLNPENEDHDPPYLMAVEGGFEALRRMRWARGVSSHFIAPPGLEPYSAALVNFASHTATERGIDLRAINGLATTDLPTVGDLGFHHIEAARRLDDDLEVWRSSLRKAVRCIRSVEGSEAEMNAAAAAIRDELMPASQAVRRAARERTRHVKTGGLRLALGCLTGTAVATVAATPIPVAALTAALGALAAYIVDAAFADRPVGSAAILTVLEQ